MGTSKQEQLDRFEGRIAADDDDSETDQDSQDSTEQQLLFSTAANTLSSQPSRSFSTWHGPESAEAAPKHASSRCSCQSDALAASNEFGSKQHPRNGENDSVGAEQHSSSSDSDTSSSDSDSTCSSDDDGDGMPPIEMATVSETST